MVLGGVEGEVDLELEGALKDNVVRVAQVRPVERGAALQNQVGDLGLGTESVCLLVVD